MTSFQELDALRCQHGLTRQQVYQRAGVAGETWRRTAYGKTAPNTRTLAKLKAALDALLKERSA